ncbi:oligosaccharide flippase family protein [Oenococcus oeni]
MHKLIRNYFYTFGYQAFLMILPVITLPYISRVLLPHGLGINSWTYSVSFYFVLFAVLGLTTYGQREVALCCDNQKKLRSVFWEIEISSIVTTCVSLCLFTLTVLFINRYPIYLAIYGLSIFSAMFDISWLFAGLENFAILSLRNILIKIGSVLAVFIFVRKPNDIGFYIFIQSATILVSNLALWPRAAKIIGYIEFPSILRILDRIRHSIYFFVPQIAISLYAVLNKVLLGFIAGTVQTGYFDSSDKIMRLLFSAFVAVSTVLLPRMSALFVKSQFEKIVSMVSSVTRISLWLIIPLTFGIVSNSRLIVSILLGNRYLTMVNTLEITALVLVPMSIANVFGNQILVPFNRIRQYTFSVVGGALINLAIAIPLISLFRANGAALSSIVSESTVTLIQIYCCKDIISLKRVFADWNSLKFGISFLAVGLVGISFLQIRSSEWIILGISLLLAGIYILVTFNGVKKELLQLLPEGFAK